jgi:hypothetical protein
MNIINTTVEFKERERWSGYSWDDVEHIWYGLLKMNNVLIFETPVLYRYDDEQQMVEEVLEKFAQHIKPPKEMILA